jgi:hypothetical protein
MQLMDISPYNGKKYHENNEKYEKRQFLPFFG